MIRCGYCSRPVRNDRTNHVLGLTRIQCPMVWKPWEKYDPKAVRRGEWWIKFLPHPMYAYVVKRANNDFQIIQPFPPYVTAPMHPYVYDLVVARIPQGF